MSEIARNYIESKRRMKEKERDFYHALIRQYGPTIGLYTGRQKTDWNQETQAAYNRYADAIDIHHRAWSMAHANGGDFALRAGEA